jgi:cellulose synthase/poly-beta-1,6-N-acetylglucosamine synthase-like glycosyltransferase
MIPPANPFAAIPPPHPGCRVTVVIPAHDEAGHIARTLTALAQQQRRDGSPLPPGTFDVLVYANNCVDATAEIARHTAERFPACAIYVAEDWLPLNIAHVGTARRNAMNFAAERFARAGIGDAILAATDADTVAAPTWLDWTMHEIQPVDAVMGRILVDPAELAALSPGTRYRLAEENAYHFARVQVQSLLAPRPYDPWPHHWQRSGPSFAVRANVYRAAGGVPPVRVLEDIALYDALVDIGARIRHSLRVRVFTSARVRSRAAGGFGSRIGEWNRLGDPVAAPLLVEHPRLTIARLHGSISNAERRLAPMPAIEATAVLRDYIACGSVARATRNTVASMAG